MNRTIHLSLTLSFICLILCGPASAWNDQTHIAIAKAAGYKAWFNAAGADITKIKAGELESFNHYDDRDRPVTQKIVLDQAVYYNDPKDPLGHLYGAIIGATREYQKAKTQGKYDEYHLAFLSHYVGDLSQPLHNSRYDDFNKKFHLDFDRTVEDEVLDNIQKITSRMYTITLSDSGFEDDVAKEVARIANIAKELDGKIRKEKRLLTKDEAYIQLSHSASLLRAILAHYKKI